jgi:hypothetical protein
MGMRFELMSVKPFQINHAWNEVYGKAGSTFRLRLLRFAPGGGPEGLAGSVSVDPDGASRVAYLEPTWLGRRLDVCLNAQGSCGEPVAHEYCRRLGYPGASGAQGASDVGPTMRLGDNASCATGCGGFASITCSRP